MYELKQVGGKTYYIDSPSKIGVVIVGGDGSAGSDVVLIDSGNDSGAAKKAYGILEEKGWHLTAILNTHSHADHIGGNKYLQNKTGCRIFSRGMEKAVIENTALEPVFLYGGYPPSELMHKFLMAKESVCLDFSDPAFPDSIEIINLPGHSFDMVGFKTVDDVIFLADCLSSKRAFEKYRVIFTFDIKSGLETLDKLETMYGGTFIPSHIDVIGSKSELLELTALNRSAIRDIADRVVNLCSEPATFEDILAGIFDSYDLDMNAEEYVVVGSTIKSYISWLSDSGRLEKHFSENKLYWSAL